VVLAELDLEERMGREDFECFFFTSLFVNSSSPLRLCSGAAGAILLVDERRGAVSIGRISLSILGLWDGGVRDEDVGARGKVFHLRTIPNDADLCRPC
jgi:hypothetical protein